MGIVDVLSGNKITLSELLTLRVDGKEIPI
jgi:hypothetical protein